MIAPRDWGRRPLLELESGLNGRLSALFCRFGWLPRRKGKAVVFWTRRPESVDLCLPIARSLARRFPRVNMLWVGAGAPRPSAVPSSDVLPPPWPAGLHHRLFAARAKVRLVVVDGPPDARASRFLAHAGRAGAQTAVLDGEDADVDDLADRLAAALDPASEPPLTGLHGVACRLAAGLGPSVRSIEALRDLLGEPRTVLCLGNGPSSEDPRLEQVAYDALFRVNHAWVSRGRLTAPDVVFTGLRSTVRAVGGRGMFVARSRDDERRLALMRLVTPRRLRTASAEALGALSADGLVPTNGATMLAVAVALAPHRIVIAGMDLFRHPAGAYPGDARTANAYAPRHDPDAELQYVLSVLDGHRGELEILSDALALEWKKHVDRRNRDRTGRGA